MRKFDLKQGWLVPNADMDGDHPGRMIYPEPMRMAEPGWVRQNWQQGEVAARPECEVSDEELEAAREWLAHLQAGRIG